MALDKLVDSTQLDTDLTSVANAIRTKGGTSAQLAFPADFVSAIAAIPTGGGGFSADDWFDGSLSSSSVVIGDVMPNRRYAFCGAPFDIIRWNKTGHDLVYGYTYVFSYSPVRIIVIPFWTGWFASSSSYTFESDANLETLDLMMSQIGGANSLRNCSSLSTIILRNSNLVSLASNASGTPFASGGAGGTIYIPKALYDHLGDGTALDYKAATNWSSLDGYGTITWAKIEGSQYENYYADGTPVSSS